MSACLFMIGPDAISKMSIEDITETINSIEGMRTPKANNKFEQDRYGGLRHSLPFLKSELFCRTYAPDKNYEDITAFARREGLSNHPALRMAVVAMWAKLDGILKYTNTGLEFYLVDYRKK